MHLSCNNCGGTCSPNPTDLRQGVVECIYCGSLQAIQGYSVEADSKLKAARKKIHIKRKGEKVTISAPKSKQTTSLNRREFGIAALITTIGPTILGAFSGNFLNPFYFLIPTVFLPWLFITFILAIVVSKFFSHGPPVVLTPGLLTSNNLGANSYTEDEIKQIYTAKISMAAGQMFAIGPQVCNVCVLTTDGLQEVILGPIDDLAVALAAEEALENELGLFNLNVVGDVDLMHEHRYSTGNGESSVPEACSTCGSKIDFDEEAKKRGFIVCSHCQHISLLYGNGEQPILGDSYSTEVPVQTYQEGSKIFLKGDTLFFIDPITKHVGWIENNVEVDRIPWNKIASIGVRPSAGSFRGISDRNQRSGAHSGSTLGLNPLDALLGHLIEMTDDDVEFGYAVILHPKGGHARTIQGSLEDPRFAFQIAEQVRAAIATDPKDNP